MLGRHCSIAIWVTVFLAPTVCFASQETSVLFEELSMEALLDSAQQRIDSGQFEEALPVLREILKRDERHMLARKALIDVLMRLLRSEEAWAEASYSSRTVPPGRSVRLSDRRNCLQERRIFTSQ